MSVFEAISLVLSFAALIGLAVSLFFSRRQTRAAALAQVQTSFIAIGNAFLDYPKLRPLFYGPTDSFRRLLGDDRERADTIAEMLLDIFVLVLELERRMSNPIERWRGHKVAVGWEPYIEELLGTSTYLREYVLSRRSWYPTLSPFLGDAENEP